jgi:hypothetical protein
MNAKTCSILVVLFAMIQPGPAFGQPALLRETNELPLPTNIMQAFRSNCALREPESGALKSYTTKIGTYTAYGDKELLPVEVDARVEGPQPPGIRLTFGAHCNQHAG